MEIKYKKHMKELWKLAGEIGALGEADNAYAEVYAKLSQALDVAEEVKLIEYTEEDGD